MLHDWVDPKKVLYRPRELMCENLASLHHGDLAMVTLVEEKVTTHHSPTATEQKLNFYKVVLTSQKGEISCLNKKLNL
jgi:hypothetical protein